MITGAIELKDIFGEGVKENIEHVGKLATVATKAITDFNKALNELKTQNPEIFTIFENEALDPTWWITPDFLKRVHPHLSISECIHLMEFAASKTIRYRDCYGNGEIIYPMWLESKENDLH